MNWRMELDTSMIFNDLKESGFNVSFLKDFNIPLTIFPELIGVFHHMQDERDAINHLLKTETKTLNNMQNKLIEQASSYYIERYKRAERENDELFIRKNSELYVDSYENMYLIQGKKYNPLIFNDYKNCIIIDLCSGPDFINFVSLIETSNVYITIDTSIFVKYAIEYMSIKKNINCINPIRCTDIDFFDKHLEVNFECVRAKNVFRYDADCYITMKKSFDKLEENGDLVIQEAPKANTFSYLFSQKKFCDLCAYYINNGATFKFVLGDPNNELSFDTLYFRKSNNSFNLIEIDRINEFISKNENYCHV